MLASHQIKRSKLLNIFSFSVVGVALFAFIFAGLCVGLDRTYAQSTTSEDTKSHQLASNLDKEFAKLSEENHKKLNLEIQRVRKRNEQLELKSKEVDSRLEKQREQLKDKESQDIAFKNANAERLFLKRQKKDLVNEINQILKKARIKEASLYDEQAKGFMKVRSFDLAITAYENSLQLNPANAQVHYAVSLLYNQVYQDRKKAVTHMKEYLKLAPRAKNRKEAQYIIDMLSEDLY